MPLKRQPFRYRAREKMEKMDIIQYRWNVTTFVRFYELLLLPRCSTTVCSSYCSISTPASATHSFSPPLQRPPGSIPYSHSVCVCVFTCDVSTVDVSLGFSVSPITLFVRWVLFGFRDQYGWLLVARRSIFHSVWVQRIRVKISYDWPWVRSSPVALKQKPSTIMNLELVNTIPRTIRAPWMESDFQTHRTIFFFGFGPDFPLVDCSYWIDLSAVSLSVLGCRQT